MIESFIKYFTIIFWTLLVFYKLINYKLSFKILIFSILFSPFLSYGIIAVRILLPEITAIVIVVFCCIYGKLLTKESWNNIIISTIISCSICYGFHFVACLIPLIIISIILYIYDIKTEYAFIISFIFTLPIQGLLIYFLFKVKRFNKGLSFIKKKHTGNIGVLVSIAVFLLYTLYNRPETSDSFAIATIIGIIICLVLIIFWWQRAITKTYLERIKENNLYEADRVIAEKDEYIEQLTKSNDTLSKIIHKDNKLIPALKLIVSEFIYEAIENAPELQHKAMNVLEQLQTTADERSEMLSRYRREYKKLIQTKIPSLDMMLKFMLKEANDNNIDFDVIVRGNIRFMVDNYIGEERLRTLIADLLENAIIAVKPCKYRKILFSIGVCGEFYEISIDDSGVDFESEILCKLGKERVTSHKDSGGNGIGIMTAFEILKETGASLIIKEYQKKDYSFSKRVSVKFDGKNEFLVLLRKNKAKMSYIEQL